MTHPGIKYSAGKNDFYRILRADISSYLKTRSNEQYADGGMVIKICACLLIYAIVYSQYISSSYSYVQWLGWCILFGFSSMLLGLNIAHDAIHRALFRKQWLNKLAGYSFDLIGVSSYVWKLKHNDIHHRYPNVVHVDFDIEAGPLLRFSPSDPKHWFHQYQHFYAPFVYMLFSLHMVFVNDFLILFKTRKHLNRNNSNSGIIFLILLQKIAYLFYTLILPVFLLPFYWWQVLLGFVIMHFTLSLFLALVLLPSHLFENTSFGQVTENGELNENWTIHQLKTTLDFASQNSLVHLLCGGFNTNVIHHLFPSICHCHYKRLSAIIGRKAAELGIPYHHTSLAGAITSHFKMLKKLGNTD